MDSLRDNIAGARALLRARHSVWGAHTKALEHLTLAIKSADDVDRLVSAKNQEIFRLQRQLQATRKELGFLRSQRTPRKTEVSNIATSTLCLKSQHAPTLIRLAENCSDRFL